MRFLRNSFIVITSSLSIYLIYYLINRKRAKKRITNKLKTPFSVNTLNRQYIGLTKDTQEKWTGSFTFIQAADTQFGLIDRYVLRKNVVKWDKEIHYLRLVIQAVNNLSPKPKFFVICGDLVDAFPTQDLRKPQVHDLKIILGELDPEIRIVCVCGNHDVGDIPTNDTVASYRNDFGDDYFSFWCNGCKFITLNSQLFFNSTYVPELKAEQNEWLLKELEKDTWKHLMIFQHIPWFIQRPAEPNHAYFNIEREQRFKWLEIFRQAGVSKIFCGHYHQNANGFYETVEVVTTSAIGAQLGADKHGFRIVEVSENEVKHRYIAVSNEIN